jgi:hypothetical protein
MGDDSFETADQVEASLNYLAEMAEKPVNYMYQPPAGTPARTGRAIKHTMAIRNGRTTPGQFSLDTHGFVLRHHETAVANFYDADQVRSAYYPEVERLVREATGAAKVLVFDHNVRCAPMAKRRENGALEPVRFAHNDYTPRSGPQRVRDLLPADEAEARLKNRFAVINVWRPIRGPVEEAPLAVCDARSIARRDFIATDLKYRDRTGEVYSLAFNPGHRWFYFPKMRRDEALLIKCFDSADDGRALFTAHTAFDDPTSPPDAAPRESIETRTLAFFAAD